jgi:hypothetical protein
MRKTNSEWQAIFQQHKDSGLAIEAFCQKHKLATSSFYKYRKLLTKESHFIQARIITDPTEAKHDVDLIKSQPGFMLEVPMGRLSLPASTSATFLIQLIRGLA